VLISAARPISGSVILALVLAHAVLAQSRRRSFPQHTASVNGAIKPNNLAPAALDDSVRAYYDCEAPSLCRVDSGDRRKDSQSGHDG